MLSNTSSATKANSPLKPAINIPPKTETVIPAQPPKLTSASPNSLMSHQVIVTASFQPSMTNQSQSVSMLNLGNSTAEVSSATAEPLLTTVSWLSDMTEAQTTSLKTHGENHGEKKVTSLWLLEILAVFATLPHMLQFDLKFKK